MLDKIEKISTSISNLNSKDFTFYFFTVEEQNINAGIIEVYNQANVLRKLGYNVAMITDADYKTPLFLDDELQTIPTVKSVEGTTITIKPEDFLIIPELFTNVLDQTRKYNCNKILFLQSYTNALRGLLPGFSWLQEYGITQIITTNQNLIDFVNKFMGQGYDIKKYTIGIPDYFKKPALPKDLTISYLSRNPQDIEMVIKLFYFQNPAYKFITFEDLRTNSKRSEFADKLNKSIGTIFIDRISSFGTLPLEAMKSHNFVCGLIPEIQPEYITEKNGLWSQSIFDLPELLASLISSYIQDSIPQEFYDNMDETVAKYTPEVSENSIKECYQYFIDKRINNFNQALEELNKAVEAEKQN
jgi:hypothetical protein